MLCAMKSLIVLKRICTFEKFLGEDSSHLRLTLELVKAITGSARQLRRRQSINWMQKDAKYTLHICK